jgi:hypothetical protein
MVGNCELNLTHKNVKLYMCKICRRFICGLCRNSYFHEPDVYYCDEHYNKHYYD